MSGRLAALATLVTLLAVWLARLAQVTPMPETFSPARASRPDPPPAFASPPPRLTRDPFRYADEPAARVPTVAPPTSRSPEPVAAPLAAPEPIRLSGFVRRGAELKAVLWVAGTTVVVAAGESAEGYRVISIDEDAGVRVRAPSGDELWLRPSSAR
jgi:hypothetical protein